MFCVSSVKCRDCFWSWGCFYVCLLRWLLCPAKRPRSSWAHEGATGSQALFFLAQARRQSFSQEPLLLLVESEFSHHTLGADWDVRYCLVTCRSVWISRQVDIWGTKLVPTSSSDVNTLILSWVWCLTPPTLALRRLKWGDKFEASLAHIRRACLNRCYIVF